MDKIKDGELYKVVSLFGKTFEIRYGYYEEFEKESKFSEPIPIYPDFEVDPTYTDDGFPFVTQMQSLCPYGDSSFPDGCCADCHHYSHGEDLIGVCKSLDRRLKVKTDSK